MCVKVLIILLLFGVKLYSGQDVAKIELDNGREVYEIREIKNNSVQLINPKKDMPILREIIFYKVIEKPYIQEIYDQVPIIEKSKDEQENGEPEFDESRRSFTNGHGLQFSDQDENAYNVENKTDLSENNNTDSNNNDSNLAESDGDDNDDHDQNDSERNDDTDINDDNDNDKNNSTFDRNNTSYDKNDDMFEYDDNTEDGNKKQLNIENQNIQSHDNYMGDDQNRNNTSFKEGNIKEESYNIGKTNIPKEDVKDKNSEEDKIQEEQLNFAKKLRDQLLNSTKEKYHSVQRIRHKTENHDRRKREVNYRNIPEAPRLPNLDVKSFPSYIQRMLANRPIIGHDEKSKPKNNYDSKLFDKMSGIFPSDDTVSGKGKTYGLKYNQGQGTSWNGIHKIQNDHISNDLDLSGSQTNNPYEVQNPTIDIRDSIPEEDETLSKNKEKSYDFPKNIVPPLDIPDEKDHFIIKKNTESENQRNTDFDNKENVNTNYMDNGFDIKNRLVDMLQNIDSKLLNRQKPRTYGMSLRGDKGEIWNDIVGAPLTNIDNTYNADVLENDSRNNPNKISNFNYDKQDNVDDEKDYDERNSNTSDNEANKFNDINDSREGNDSYNNDNKKELDNYDKSHSDEEKAPGHEVNNAEKTPFSVNLINMPSPTPKLPDFNEQFRTSTTKPKISHEQVNEHHTTGIPNYTYFSQKSTERPIKVTETTKFDEPEVEKEHQPIESLRRKMEESFDNIIKQFPKLEPMKETTDDIRKNEAGNNNKKPRTYGMHLEGDHGYVWNDLTNPGIHVNVGDLENIEVTEPSVDELMPNSSIDESISAESNSESPIETTTMEYEKKSDTTTNKQDEETTEVPITTTTERESVTEKENNVTTEKIIDKKLDAKKDCTCKNDTLTKEKVESSDKNNGTESIKVTLDDLLTKDEFWQWLSNWTTTYMDVLNERVEKLVEDKVSKRLENNTNDENNNNDEIDPDKKNNQNNDTIKMDKEKDNNDNDESSKNPNFDQLKTNKNNSNINNVGKEKSNSTEIQSEKDISNSNKTVTAPEKSDIKPISEDKINNTEDTSEKKNNSLPFNIKADTIYGNAIDSDHVTNIFIFYPNVKLNKTIDESEPLIIKTNLANEKPANVTFDERIGIPENDDDNQINKPETSTEISSSTQSNTESIIDVTSTSESRTTTEGLAKNTSKEIEESQNGNNLKPSKITDSDLKEPEKVTEKSKDNNNKTETPNTDHNETTTETTKTENSKETTKLSDKEATTESVKIESDKTTTILSDNKVTTELPKPEINKNTTINEKETTTESSKKENDKETTTELIKKENDETTKVEDNKTTTPTSDDNVKTTDKPEITTKTSTDKPPASDTSEKSTDSKDTSDVKSTEKSAGS